MDTNSIIQKESSTDKMPLICEDFVPFLKSEKKRWWVITGIYYGYPSCCIVDFCKRGYKIKHEQEMVHGSTGFIPCPECAKKILNKETTLDKLLSNRVCDKKFPDDDF